MYSEEYYVVIGSNIGCIYSNMDKFKKVRKVGNSKIYSTGILV